MTNNIDTNVEEWYDADGTPNENGCYDAGGHFYAERASDYSDSQD